MSIRYNNASGQETILSGLTPGGDIEAGAVATRSGKVDVSPLEVGAYQVVNVAFDTPMPDDTYIINTDCTSGRLNIATFNKTANGFSIVYLNSSNLTQPQGDSIDWTATKTYTVQHAAQNAEDIAALKQATPAGAGPNNKFATANDITRIENSVEDISEVIDSTASITNKLVSKSTMDTALGEKQDTLEFDDTPTAGSENPVTSAGIKSALDSKQNTLTFDNVPTENSNNVVKSSGVYSAVDNIYKVMGQNGAKNLLSYPFYQTTRTNNGITYTDNGDGTITANGTATNTSTFSMSTRISSQKPNTYLKNGTYILSSGISGESATTYELQAGITIDGAYYEVCKTRNGPAQFTINGSDEDTEGAYIAITIVIRTGYVADNLTFYPMLRLASDTDSTWQPYAKTNQQLTVDKAEQTEVNDIVNVYGAKNILKNEVTTNNDWHGVSRTVNADFTITLNGMSTAWDFANFNYVKGQKSIPSGTYIISGGCENTALAVVADGSVIARQYGSGETVFTITDDMVETYARFEMSTDKTFTSENSIIKPMIRSVSIQDSTYEPYAKTNQELTSNVIAIDNARIMYGVENILPNTLGSGTAATSVTYTKNSDGTVSVSGSAVGNAILAVGKITGLTKVRLTGCPSGGSGAAYQIQPKDLTDNTYPFQGDYGVGRNYTLDPTHVYRMDIVIREGYSISGTKLFKPMVVDLNAYSGTTYDDYVPYAKSNRELTEDQYINVTNGVDVKFTQNFTTSYIWTVPEDGWYVLKLQNNAADTGYALTIGLSPYDNETANYIVNVTRTVGQAYDFAYVTLPLKKNTKIVYKYGNSSIQCQASAIRLYTNS